MFLDPLFWVCLGFRCSSWTVLYPSSPDGFMCCLLKGSSCSLASVARLLALVGYRRMPTSVVVHYLSKMKAMEASRRMAAVLSSFVLIPSQDCISWTVAAPLMFFPLKLYGIL